MILYSNIDSAFPIPISNISRIFSFSLFRRPQVLITMEFNTRWKDVS